MFNKINNLKVFKTISSSSRNSALDICRAIAILSIIIYHYYENEFPYGYIGVDLFFVISGFLVGGILIKELSVTGTINYFRFFIARSFKIWPSYFFFLFIGNIIAYFLYKELHPEYYIPIPDLYRYVFFIKNFIGIQYHWCFEHLWSICVEEHFYFFTPIFFILLLTVLKKGQINFSQILLYVLIGLILAGVGLKYLLYKYYATSINSYEISLVRIDELAWGMLTYVILNKYSNILTKYKLRWFFVITGFGFLAFILYTAVSYRLTDMPNFILFCLLPFSFSLIIAGIYELNFSKLKLLRIIAYFSYNWYLWHTIFIPAMQNKMQNALQGFFVYFIFTFIIAILTTITVEESFLTLRGIFFKKYFYEK